MNAFRLARSVAVAAALATAVPFAAHAQVAVGAKVVDKFGNLVGTVIARSGDMLTVKTNKHEVPIPVASFTPHEGKLLYAETQAQLNAKMDAALAAAAASIAVGAEVTGRSGAVIGTIEKIDTEAVTLKLTSGELVRMPKDGVSGSQTGPVVGMTLAELQAVASGGASAEATAEVETPVAATAAAATTEAEASAQ